MINVLVAYASKHGSTREIAEVIGNELEDAGLRSDVRDVASVESLDNIHAVVIGSAIYVGKWQEDAVAFIDARQSELRRLPAWLFSSGPIGEDPFPQEEPPATPELIEKAGARDYRSFAGRLDRAQLGLGERLVTRVVRAPEGDFREWEEIRDWARMIGRTLQEGESIESEDQSDRMGAGRPGS